MSENYVASITLDGMWYVRSQNFENGHWVIKGLGKFHTKDYAIAYLKGLRDFTLMCHNLNNDDAKLSICEKHIYLEIKIND